MWWEKILENLPVVIICVLAIIFCGADLIKALGVWKASRKKKIDEEVQKAEKEINLEKTLTDINSTLIKMQATIESQATQIESLNKKVSDLTISDMHDIKSWIVEQYHKFYVQQGWIDAFSADTLDHRYEDYKLEGGNSYVDALMQQMHTLPMDPEQGIHKNK